MSFVFEIQLVDLAQYLIADMVGRFARDDSYSKGQQIRRTDYIPYDGPEDSRLLS